MLRLQPSNKSHDGHLQENGELFGLLEDLQGKIFQYQVRFQPSALLKINEDNRRSNKRRLVIKDSNR